MREYVIGADGGRSVVRKSQDIGFEGFTYPERFLVITTATIWKRGATPTALTSPIQTSGAHSRCPGGTARRMAGGFPDRGGG